jgi:hypothetical protein
MENNKFLDIGAILVITCLLCFVSYKIGQHSVKQISQTESRESNRTHEVIELIKHRDGTIRTITTIDSKTDRKQDNLTVTPVSSHPKSNLSGIVANDFSKSLSKPIYGLSYSREFIGPFTVGIIGFNNGTLGVTVGFDF